MTYRDLWLPSLLVLGALTAHAQDTPRPLDAFGKALSQAIDQPTRELRAVRVADVQPIFDTTSVTAGIAPGSSFEEDEDDEDDYLGRHDFQRDVDDYAESDDLPGSLPEVDWDFPEETAAPPPPPRTKAPIGGWPEGDVAEFNGLKVTRLRLRSQSAAEEFQIRDLAPRYGVDGRPTAMSDAKVPVVYELRGSWLLAVSGEAVLDPALARRALAAGWAGLGDRGPVTSRMVNLPGQGLAIRSRSTSPRLLDAYYGALAAKQRAGDTTRTQIGERDGERRVWHPNPRATATEEQAFAAYTEAFFAPEPEQAPPTPRTPTVGIVGRLQGK